MIRSLRSAVVFTCISAFALGADGPPTYDLSIRISNRAGAPAAGMHVTVAEVLVSNKLVTKFDGALPTDGTIRIAGLRGGKSRPVHRIYAGPNDEQIDTFRYEGPEAPKVRELKLPLMTGDAAPEAAFVNVLNGARSELSDYRGQVVFLDFWATWCVPCRPAMDHNQDAMKRRAKDWAGKAVIIGMNGDEKPELAKKFVEERGWTAVLQVWNIDSPGTGAQTQAILDFGIDDIPRAVLIGKDGKILWRGDPNKIDPEKLIEDALK